MTTSVRAAVLGASGYVGAELLRYLGTHPAIEVVWLTADSNAGKPVGEVFGHLPEVADLRFETTDPATVPEVGLAFLALPHGAAAEHGRALAQCGVAVVDLSADWRLADPAQYVDWYGAPHPHPDDLPGWVYGLPELYRDTIAGSRRVANPGCYPTAAVLALAPLLREGAVDADRIVIDAASGVSGAGRKVEAGYLFTEIDASFKAYGVATHRHTPEIEQELSHAAGGAVHVTFTPHLVPMARGLLATCYAKTDSEIKELHDVLATSYKGEPFVSVLAPGAQPATKQVSGSNHAVIGVALDERTRTAVVTCAIDNLGKGAASQAIQNANIMLGFEEDAGINAAAVFP